MSDFWLNGIALFASEKQGSFTRSVVFWLCCLEPQCSSLAPLTKYVGCIFLLLFFLLFLFFFFAFLDSEFEWDCINTNNFNFMHLFNSLQLILNLHRKFWDPEVWSWFHEFLFLLLPLGTAIWSIIQPILMIENNLSKVNFSLGFTKEFHMYSVVSVFLVLLNKFHGKSF